MANKIGFENAQTLRDEGYRLNEIGKVGRWNTDKCSKIRHTVDEFAGVFDKVCWVQGGRVVKFGCCKCLLVTRVS